MEKCERLDRLFFELASDSRLNILIELQANRLKMQEISRRLDLSSTEAFRQLCRLSEELLIQKLSDGTYTMTTYGRLVMQLSPSMGFVFKHRDYFMAHDLERLPLPFIHRIGELSRAELTTSMLESTNRSSKIVGEAREYLWGISSEPFPQSFDTIAEQFPQNAQVRFLSPLPPKRMPGLENRTITDIPAIMVMNEKEAGVSFQLVGGRTDYAAFFGHDPVFLNWVRDLFRYCWDNAKRA